MKYCQGPKCHTYDTKDRKRGPKDNKRNETSTDKLLDLLRVLIDKVTTNANNINTLAKEVAKLKEVQND